MAEYTEWEAEIVTGSGGELLDEVVFMTTYAEWEAEMEPILIELAEELDRLDAEDAAIEARYEADSKTAPVEAKADVSGHIDALRAKNEEARQRTQSADRSTD